MHIFSSRYFYLFKELAPYKCRGLTKPRVGYTSQLLGLEESGVWFFVTSQELIAVYGRALPRVP